MPKLLSTIPVFSKRFGAKQHRKMPSTLYDVPLGISIVKRLNNWLCPRLRVDRLRCYQASILVLTFLTYMTYHLTRKPISIVKSVLHRNCSGLVPPPGTDPAVDPFWCSWEPFNTTDANTLLGTLDSAFLFSYAGAMFMSGMVAERVDLRYFLTLGMLFSAAFCYLFGIAKTFNIHSLWYFLIVQALAGVAQTTGWPGTVALVGKWFGKSKKGLIFGIWNSHTSLGNILGTLIASTFVESDWSLSFIYPALVMGACAALVMLFLVPEPHIVGIDAHATRRLSRCSRDEDDSTVTVSSHPASLRPGRHSTNSSPYEENDELTEHTSLLSRSHTKTASAVSLSRALTIPFVVEFALSLFFAKLVSYTFLFWLPLYINSSTQLTPKESGQLSMVFDLGGIVGAIAAGVLSDRYGTPGCVCSVMYTLAAPFLLFYQLWGATSFVCNVILLVIVGLLVNGPYALITTAVSAELGTHSSLSGNSQALATVTAIIDGTGSIGAAIGPMLAGVVSARGDWSHVFYMLIICDVMAMLLLLRVVRGEILKIRQNRLINSLRAERIE